MFNFIKFGYVFTNNLHLILMYKQDLKLNNEQG